MQELGELERRSGSGWGPGRPEPAPQPNEVNIILALQAFGATIQTVAINNRDNNLSSVCVFQSKLASCSQQRVH